MLLDDYELHYCVKKYKMLDGIDIDIDVDADEEKETLPEE